MEKKQDYSNMEMIVNWNESPVLTDENGRQFPNKLARQMIYSTVSKMIPDGDYSVYIGKVIHKIYINKFNHVVLCLRNPEPGDLSEENLNRQPITASQTANPEPESIMEPVTSQDILMMRKKMEEAKRRIEEAQRG